MGVDIKRFVFQISCASDHIPAEDVSLTLKRHSGLRFCNECGEIKIKLIPSTQCQKTNHPDLEAKNN